jgi:hypothetical protein
VATEREGDGPRAQVALLCGLIAVVVTGELLIGPPSAKAWTALDVFLAAACFTVAGMLLSARLLGAAWVSFAFLGGAILASAFLPLVNAVWLMDHALALLAGVVAGAVLLIRR